MSPNLKDCSLQSDIDIADRLRSPKLQSHQRLIGNSKACDVKGKVISFVDGSVGDGTKCMADAFQPRRQC